MNVADFRLVSIKEAAALLGKTEEWLRTIDSPGPGAASPEGVAEVYLYPAGRAEGLGGVTRTRQPPESSRRTRSRAYH